MPNGRRPVSRGVARRNAKLAALRELVSKDRAMLVFTSPAGKPLRHSNFRQFTSTISGTSGTPWPSAPGPASAS